MTNDMQRMQLKDGRYLAFSFYGDPAGFPVLYMHNSPGARVEAAIFGDRAAEYGLRLIAADRPGMGRSSYRLERDLLDWPGEMKQLLGELGVDRFGLLSWSGGGAYALATARAMPEQVAFTITMAAYSNFAEMPGAEELVTTLANRMSVPFSQKFAKQFAMFYDLMGFSLKYMPEMYFEKVIDGLSQMDKLILTDPLFKEQFTAQQREGMAYGGRGAAQDAALQYVDWGFPLAEVPGKVHVFHGTADMAISYRFAEHLAAALPDAELHPLEDQGHYFPVMYQDVIFQTAVAELDR